jgi:predicted glutamine amidotransferase
MCIIIFKPKNRKMPSDEIIKRCFESNPNGAGIMYRNKDNQIVINKGFMTIEALQEAIKEISKNVELRKTDVCIHFRISTTGSTIPANCHPFPLSNEINDLKELSVIVDRAIAHNGILHDYSKLHNQETDLSDTMYFAKMLSGVNDRFLQNVISAHAINSRFVLMTNKKTLTWGLINDKGLFYSNTSYKPQTTTINQFSNWEYLQDKYPMNKNYKQTDLCEIADTQISNSERDRKSFERYLKNGSTIDLYSM